MQEDCPTTEQWQQSMKKSMSCLKDDETKRSVLPSERLSMNLEHFASGSAEFIKQRSAKEKTQKTECLATESGEASSHQKGMFRKCRR